MYLLLTLLFYFTLIYNVDTQEGCQTPFEVIESPKITSQTIYDDDYHYINKGKFGDVIKNGCDQVSCQEINNELVWETLGPNTLCKTTKVKKGCKKPNVIFHKIMINSRFLQIIFSGQKRRKNCPQMQ